MRLINAEETKLDIDFAFETGESDDKILTTTNELHEIIDKTDTVDAIPVKFIEDQMKIYLDDKDFEHSEAYFDLIEAWKAEKEE